MVGGCGFVTVVNVTTSLDNWVLYRHNNINVYNKWLDTEPRTYLFELDTRTSVPPESLMIEKCKIVHIQFYISLSWVHSLVRLLIFQFS